MQHIFFMLQLTISLLTSMPAITGMILAIPVGRMLERQRNIVPWYSRARVWVLSSYALTGLVPFFFAGTSAAIPIIAIWAIATIPQTIVSIAFTVVIGAATRPVNGRATGTKPDWRADSVIGPPAMP